MRAILLAAACAGTLSAAGAAHAQYAVIDHANLANTAKTVTQGAEQIQRLETQIATMRDQLTTAQQTFASLAHAPEGELAQFSGQFNSAAFRNIFAGNDAGSIGRILNGSGLSGLGTLGQEYAEQNRVYQPPASDSLARQMTTNAASIAGVQGLANQLFFSSSQHIAAIQTLEGELSDAPDEKTVGDIQARVATEQTYIAAQQVQAQAIQTWQAAQVRNVDEQNAETQRQNIDDVLAQDAANTNGG